MKSKTAISIGIATSLALMLAFAGLASAWHGPSRDNRGRGDWNGDEPAGDRRGGGPNGGVLCDGPRAFGHDALGALRDLDLSRDQRERVHDLLENHRQELGKASDSLQELRDSLRRESLAAKPNEARIRELSRNLGQAMGDLALLGSRVAGAVEGVLTPEQQERFGKGRDGREMRGMDGRRGCGAQR